MPYFAPDRDELQHAAHTLLLHTVLQSVADALADDPLALLWVLTDGNDMLEDMGWGRIDLSHPELINVELLDRTLDNAPVRRCRDCVHCFRDGEHALCLLGVWERRGMRPRYGVLTVDKGMRGKIHACGYWRTRG